jgi:hypothetical protein
METVTFFRQQRADKAIRSGLCVGEEACVNIFSGPEPGDDPILLWYVDVRCDGLRARSIGRILDWFRRNRHLAVKGLRRLAEKVRAGMDSDIWPVEEVVKGTPRGVKMRVVCSAARRMSGVKIAKRIEETATHWDEYLQALQRAEVA